MNAQLPLDFSVNPGSLNIQQHDFQKINMLYDKYKEELVAFCTEMRQVRKSMLQRGFAADFSDRESELLYLLVREMQPSAVVEISPCHGYSTNYILAALTHNKKGKLYSYEISEQVNGIPIKDAIFSNLADSVDKSRLELVIGDATKASIPEHDFLFIDSNHEAWFASWFFSKIIEMPEIVFMHDILIHPKNSQSLLPKATFLGIREQYYVLQALHTNRQLLFSVADFSFHMEQSLRSSIPVRYDDDYSDRR